ncbi:hypothetical protein HY389_01180 [Candidatus Daviesbacteria bacterium]|nr:hypothetical protein [Candidatus Daviesbacteria bacterium]
MRVETGTSHPWYRLEPLTRFDVLFLTGILAATSVAAAVALDRSASSALENEGDRGSLRFTTQAGDYYLCDRIANLDSGSC